MSGYYCCKKDYQSPYPDSIPFRAGEEVLLGEEYDQDPEWQDWIRCKTGDGREAWIPKQFLDIKGDDGFLLKEYDALELTILEGEIVLVTETINGFGMAKKKNGERGWVPLNHLEFQKNQLNNT